MLNPLLLFLFFLFFFVEMYSGECTYDRLDKKGEDSRR